MLDEGVRLGLEYFGLRSRAAVLCEWEAYAAACLLARMDEQSLEPAPIWCGDLAEFDGQAFHGLVDLLCAGFPCQPWSCAGKQAGTADDRWLWPAIANIIRDVGPSVVFLENVPGLVSGGGLDHVLSDLAEMRFDAEWTSLTAEAVGASHRRERVFILAYPAKRADAGIFRHAQRETRQAECGNEGRRVEIRGTAEPRHTSGEHVADSLRRERQPRPGRKRILDDGAAVALPAIRGRGELREPSERDGLTYGGDKPLANAGRQHRARRRAAGIVAGTSGAIEVDGEQRERCGDAVDNCEPTMADSSGTRPQERRSEPGNAIEELPTTERNDGDMEYASGGGSCRPLAESSSDCERMATNALRSSQGIFAPGPSADWRAIPEALWPAIESGFCQLVAGQPVVVDESRTDQLRCCGNQVVALQAATAFVGLMRRAFDL